MSISDPSRPSFQSTQPISSSSNSSTIAKQEPFTTTTTAKTTTTHASHPPTMSRSDTSSTTKQATKHTTITTTTTTTTSKFTPSTAELQKLDTIYTTLSAAIPERPYLLSVPVNVEPRYHYPSRQEAESWQRNTPFYLHEEGLQYMSFVLRDQADSCFKIASFLDEERERAAEVEKSRERFSKHSRNGSAIESAATTRPGTPVTAGATGGGSVGTATAGATGTGTGTGTKKKISWNAYKSKLEGKDVSTKDPTPEKETIAPAMEKAERKAEKQVNGVKSDGKAEDRPAKKAEALNAGIKRQRDSDLEKPTSASDKAPSVKKMRVTPPPSHKPARQPSPRPSLQPSAIHHPNGAPHGLPALLSPTNPFESSQPTDKPSTPEKKKKKKANKWDLPDMLSPTLPPKIEAELAREKERGGPISATSSPASKATRTPGSSAQSPALKAPPAPKLEESALAKAKDGTKELVRAVESEEDDEEEVVVEEETATSAKMSTRSIVRLKYSKKLAYRVKSILRIPPRPDRKTFPLDDDYLARGRAERPMSKSIAELSGGGKPKPRATSDATSSPLQRPKKDVSVRDELRKDRLHPDTAKIASTKTPEKRARHEDPEPVPVSKKQKVPSSLDLDKEKNPRTPIASAIPSPALQKSGGSLRDSITVTPRQGHLKAVAMARSASADSPVATPNGKLNSQGTPQPPAASRPTSKGPTSAPISGPRKAQAESLQELSAKYNKLGRDLKHENQDINKKTGERTVPELKRMALLGMECIMSYMLAYSLGDASRELQNKPAEIDASWVSLLPLFKHMRHFMRRYEPLLGLHNYLGIAINARIASVAGERSLRLSHLPWPADSPQSTNSSTSQPRSGSGAHPSAQEIQRYFDAVSAMTECTRAAVSTFPAEVVQTRFPATWAARDTGRRGQLTEPLLDEKSGEASLRGSYWVPVGVDSAPVQAVRFGVQVLREWIREGELGYEPRIRI